MLVNNIDYMALALEQANLALGKASPNPAVGAIIVKDGVIVGMGYTQPPGSDHAEIMALKQAGEQAKGATLYVTLEPCCHQGRTGPCTEAIIVAGIIEVHMALLDQNPLVCGGGMKRLEQAGIKVIIGEYENEARKLNEGFFKYITTGVPFVIAKYAMSLDGKIATRSGDSRWISNEECRQYVHKMRRIVDAVMIGINTVIIDDPHLTARDGDKPMGKQPVRIIVDSKGRVPSEARVFNQPGRTIIAVADSLNGTRVKQLQKSGVDVIRVSTQNGLIVLSDLLIELGKRQITTVLVEGGSALLGSLVDRRLIDKVMVFIAPLIIGGAEAKSAVGGAGVEAVASAMRLKDVTIDMFGDNILVSGYPSGG